MLGIASSSLTIMVLSAFVTAAPQHIARQAAPALSLTAQLSLADLATDRYALLPTDTDFVFDFNKGGSFANRKTFPALVGSGIAMAVAPAPPCSIVPVHTHPRANELLVVLTGRLMNYMIPEAGVMNANGSQRVIQTELTANTMTINPQGAFHTIYNPDCEPASAVVAFSSEDQGLNAIANSFFSYDDYIIANELNQALSGSQIDAVRQAVANRTLTIQECIKKCNITMRH